MIQIFRRLIIAALFLATGFAQAETASQTITLGITPQHSPTELAKLWGPICQYLSEHSGYLVQFKTSKDLNAFWEDTNKGAFDLVYINPPRYTEAHTAMGYAAFAKDDSAPLIPIIVVRKDGPQNIKALDGQKLAVPSLSALASQIPQAYMLAQGIHVTLTPVVSHESVFRTVEKGLFPAGASNQRIFGMLDPATQAQFHILWKADPLPPFAYAAHPRVPPKAVEKIKQTLLEMDDNPTGRALLSAMNIKAVVAAKDSDYDSMRKLKLQMK